MSLRRPCVCVTINNLKQIGCQYQLPIFFHRLQASPSIFDAKCCLAMFSQLLFVCSVSNSIISDSHARYNLRSTVVLWGNSNPRRGDVYDFHTPPLHYCFVCCVCSSILYAL